jgi:hypothetical protein
MDLRIGWLYGHEMNIYGDRGNVLSLARRAEWRGIEARVTTVGLGERFDAASFDVLFWGGGQDREQIAVAADLAGEKGRALALAVEDGMPVLAIWRVSILGHITAHSIAGLPGIGALDVHSGAEHAVRGNVVVETSSMGRWLGSRTLRAYVSRGWRQPLGFSARRSRQQRRTGPRRATVTSWELPARLTAAEEPEVGRLVDQAALRRGHDRTGLAPLDDALEQRAHDDVVSRPGCR